MDGQRTHQGRSTGWSQISAPTPDALLALIKSFDSDPRPEKIDLGVGVYKDERGVTPVMAAVKLAEEQLVETQSTKSYLGGEGDTVFVDLLRPMIFGDGARAGIVGGLQTPGGTGALRLGAELLKASGAHPVRIHLGVPAWTNHAPIFRAAGLEVVEHPYLAVETLKLAFDRIMEALNSARSGDAVLLQAGGHNPTGVDLTLAQWREVGAVMARRGLIPFVDMAYQGLCQDLETDALGARAIMSACPDAILAYSCNKNFGLYRDRVGALFVQTERQSEMPALLGTLAAVARVLWSMPPDHGAAVVRLILEDDTLRKIWLRELFQMRQRIAGIRTDVSTLSSHLSPLLSQQGMFSMLPLSKRQIMQLRDAFGIYMAGSGRISLCGLNTDNLRNFAAAITHVMSNEA